MSMNLYIGAMLRSWMKDAAQTDSRALELKVGQIVRGVLLQMLEDGEALMNIGGALVRARLETSLQPGKGTMLQVMPGSSGSTVILKAIGEAGAQVPDEGLKDALKSFGLPDQKWAYDMLRGLRSDGYPINKDTAAFFHNAAMLRPAGADPSSWMMAAEVAFRRGLPASAEAIGALRQALFGQPLREELAALMDKLNTWLKTEGGGNSRVAELAARLQALLAEGEEILNQGRQQLAQGTPAAPASSVAAQHEGARPAPQAGAAVTAQPAAAGLSDAARAAFAQGSIRPDAELAQQPARAPQAASAPNASAPNPAAQAAASPSAAAAGISGALAPEAANAGQAVMRPPGGNAEAAPPQNTVPPEAAGTGNQAAATAAGKGDVPWIGRFLQWLGFSHEHQLMQEWGNIRRADAGQGTMPGEAQLPAGERAAGELLRGAQETLKSVLLTMARMEDVPPQIRDAAQSLVQHITGQQLLLASERQAGSPMSIMTMFVPLKGEDGETTATIHVQTRRGRKGEWDADNCRLLFDLQMRYLGETIVDVQVVDRIVSIKIMNDYPAMADMTAQAREQLEEGLRAAGFQLLSMTVQPLPSVADRAPAEEAEAAEARPAVTGAVWSPKPYKGVDYRV